MGAITVLRFPTAEGAEEAMERIRERQRQHPVELHDAALVSWAAGARSPGTRPITDLRTTQAAGGVFWGMLFGLLFFTPLLGVGGGIAAVTVEPPLVAYGVDDRFIHRVRESATEGTSAIFLLAGDAATAIELALIALKDSVFDIIATKFSRDEERHLRGSAAQN